ncbi:hypothetical protein RCL1_009058 [Eukaryota sp. TZLM3-RCL]
MNYPSSNKRVDRQVPLNNKVKVLLFSWNPAIRCVYNIILFGFLAIAITGLIGSLKYEDGASVNVAPSSNILLRDVDTSLVEKVRFSNPGHSTNGKIYKCSSLPPVLPQTTTISHSGIYEHTCFTDMYMTWLNLAVDLHYGSFVSYNYETTMKCDFFLFQSRAERFQRSIPTNPVHKGTTRGSGVIVTPKTESYYWVFSNGKGKGCPMEFNANLNMNLTFWTFDVNSDLCQAAECVSSKSEFSCEIPITKDSDEVVIIAADPSSFFRLWSVFSMYPKTWGISVLVFGIVGTLICSVLMVIASFEMVKFDSGRPKDSLLL